MMLTKTAKHSTDDGLLRWCHILLCDFPLNFVAYANFMTTIVREYVFKVFSKSKNATFYVF